MPCRKPVGPGGDTASCQVWLEDIRVGPYNRGQIAEEDTLFQQRIVNGLPEAMTVKMDDSAGKIGAILHQSGQPGWICDFGLELEFLRSERPERHSFPFFRVEIVRLQFLKKFECLAAPTRDPVGLVTSLKE